MQKMIFRARREIWFLSLSHYVFLAGKKWRVKFATAIHAMRSSLILGIARVAVRAICSLSLIRVTLISHTQLHTSRERAARALPAFCRDGASNRETFCDCVTSRREMVPYHQIPESFIIAKSIIIK